MITKDLNKRLDETLEFDYNKFQAGDLVGVLKKINENLQAFVGFVNEQNSSGSGRMIGDDRFFKAYEHIWFQMKEGLSALLETDESLELMYYRLTRTMTHYWDALNQNPSTLAPGCWITPKEMRKIESDMEIYLKAEGMIR